MTDQPTPTLSLTIPPRDHTPPEPDGMDRPDYAAAIAGIRDKARANGIGEPRQSPADRAAERERAAAAQRAQQRADAAVAGIPTRFRGGTVEHPGVRAWVNATARGAGESLVMVGGVGTGKTHQAFAAWSELVAGRHHTGHAQWMAMPAWLDGLRPGREPTVDYAAAADAGLLLMDDLAAERGSEWTVEVVYRLLDHRYAWQLPTIITTNVTDIRATMGDRIASRLNGMGDRVSFDGPDRRTRPAAGSPTR